MGKALIGFVVGALLCGIVALVSFAKVEETSEVKFCASCHEMQVFYDTWKTSAHGISHRGVIRARCVDCHLPHGNFVDYLITKAVAGMSDYYAHMTGKKAKLSSWLEELESRRNVEKPAFVYESGCRKCHKELVGNGIPLKAFLAHRSYLLGETDKTCVSCHRNVGHGDVIAYLRAKVGKK